MAKGILAVQPLSRNDISILANLFELSFDYYIAHDSSFFPDYLKSLRTVVGLGFTAALVADTSILCIYQHHLDHFMAQRQGDFRTHRNAKTLIAQSVAEMVGTAAVCFSILRCPKYYQDFFAALCHTIAQIAHSTNQYSEVERILDQLSVE